MIYKVFKQSLFLSSLALFAAVVISGCSSTTTPTSTTPDHVSPKTGSSYTFTKSSDTAGTKVPGSDTTYSAIVIADSITVHGQSNAYTVLDGGDTSHLAYAANNDVMIYIQSTGLTGLFQSVGDAIYHRWIPLGISSKQKGTLVFDTIVFVPVPGFPISVQADVHIASDYIGDEDITVGTEKLTANHCVITATGVSNSPQLITPAVTYSNQRDFYFVKKLGYFTKVTTNQVIPSVAALGAVGSNTGTTKVLTAYTIK